MSKNESFLFEDCYPEILKRYQSEVFTDVEINQMNIIEKSTEIISIKHKWVCRLMECIHDLERLEQNRKNLEAKLIEKLNEDSATKLSMAAAERIVSQNETLKKVDGLIMEKKLVKTYLDNLVNVVLKFSGNDIKNLIDSIKLETM